MIPEREREALMRLTMCARRECRICMYQKRCDFDFRCELATKNMNILADALRAEQTEPKRGEPNASKGGADIGQRTSGKKKGASDGIQKSR